jgi:ParB-like nuclease domain
MARKLSVGVVREVPLKWLRPWPENPRWISATRFDNLKRALLYAPGMLWGRPLLVLPDGTVFSGNQRLRAAIELGWDSIPVHCSSSVYSAPVGPR